MTNHTNTATPVFGFLPQDVVALAARLLLAAIFLIAGVGKIATIEATTG